MLNQVRVELVEPSSLAQPGSQFTRLEWGSLVDETGLSLATLLCLSGYEQKQQRIKRAFVSPAEKRAVADRVGGPAHTGSLACLGP